MADEEIISPPYPSDFADAAEIVGKLPGWSMLVRPEVADTNMAAGGLI